MDDDALAIIIFQYDALKFLADAARMAQTSACIYSAATSRHLSYPEHIQQRLTVIGKVAMTQLADLLEALERTGDQPGRSVSAHLDPALNEAAKTAVALGLAESVSALTGTELRRLALHAVLDAYYDQRPDDRPHIAEVALFLAKARKLPFAGRADLSSVLRALADAMGSDVDPETLLAATVGHLATGGSAA